MCWNSDLDNGTIAVVEQLLLVRTTATTTGTPTIDINIKATVFLYLIQHDDGPSIVGTHTLL